MSADVAIVDSGGSNIASLLFALEWLGVDARLTGNSDSIRTASHVILPGVGAAATAMARLQQQQLADTIRRLTQPVLGICLGMQLLCESSEEEDTACLGVLPATAKRMHGSTRTPVPHMGWSRVTTTREHPLLDGIENGSWFYFVHSYALPVGNICIAQANHGASFCAIAGQDNFLATQFHPERSAAAGARLLRNFLGIGA
jgi:glutamine amidotransferase